MFYSFQRWRNVFSKVIRQNVHIFIPIPVLPCSWPSLVEPCRVTPGWVCSVRCLETTLAPFLVLFPFSRCSNGTDRSLGNFPFCSSSSLLLPSGPFLFYFHSADVFWPPLPHWPEWISCGSAYPWVCTGTGIGNRALPMSKIQVDVSLCLFRGLC